MSSPLPDHVYASVIREHLWIVIEGNARLVEERIGTGFASCRNLDGRTQLDACDSISALRPEARKLLGVDPAALPGMLAETVSADESALLENFRSGEHPGTFRVRTMRRARYVSNGRVDDAQSSAWMTASREDLEWPVTILCSEDEIEQHLPTLLSGSQDRASVPPDWKCLPILWSAGSASVLLHEAVGHPAERGLAPAALPPWLVVADRPARPGPGAMRFDDCANVAEDRLLSNGELPSCFRRESFRTVPLRRMSNLHAEVQGDEHSLELPRRFLSVKIVSHGDFDPLTDIVRLTVGLADLVDGNSVTRLSPFNLKASREGIARSIHGAEGAPITYPGVLCSEDGQKLPVGSAAPLLFTLPFTTT